MVATVVHSKPELESVKVSSETLRAIAGEYEAAEGNRSIVTMENDKLFWSSSFNPAKKSELKAADEHTFFMDNNLSRWTFLKNDSGQITVCVIHTSDGYVLIRKKIQ